MKIFIFPLLILGLFFAGCSGDDEIPSGLGPFVKATVPADGTRGVSTDVSITVYFNKAVSKKSVEKLLSLMEGNALVQNLGFQWTQNNEILTLVLPGGATFLPNTEYTLTILKGFEDTKGRLSENTFMMKFYTGFNAIPITFAVTSVMPLDETTEYPQFKNQQFIITFSDCVNPASISNNSIFIAPTAGGQAINAELVISTHLREVTIINTSALKVNTGYTITVKSTVSNNRIPAVALGTDFTSTFATGNYKNEISDVMLKTLDGSAASSSKKADATGDYYENDGTESKNYGQ